MRERSPVDVLHAVIAAVLLILLVILEAVAGDSITGFVHDLSAGLSAVPDWLLNGLVVLVRVAALVAVIAGVVAVIAHRRWRLGVCALAAGVLAAAMQSVLGRVANSEAAAVVSGPSGLGPVTGSEFPTDVGLAVIAAAVTASAPWLGRRWRRFAWALVVGAAIARAVTAPIAFDTPIALVVGWLSGSIVLIVAGGPLRRPGPVAVEAGLAGVGLPVTGLHRAGVDARGSTPYFGTADGVGSVFVKVLSADERSADLLFRAYRRIDPHRLGDERPESSLRRTVEHEALVSLTANRFGVRTPRVEAFAEVGPGAFALAYQGVDGHSLDEVEPARLTDERITAIWDQVLVLRGHRIAHRDLRLANMFLDDDDQIWMIDFGFSELAASDLLLRTDLAELVASLCTAIGPDRALGAAVAAVGPEAVADASSRLRPFALSGATRTSMKENPGLLDDLASRARALA